MGFIFFYSLPIEQLREPFPKIDYSRLGKSLLLQQQKKLKNGITVPVPWVTFTFTL